jgi:hypothetical protein
MTSVVDAESLLAIDIGSVNTRALLFDVVDGQYHFLAAGMASSTWGAPFFDVGEGVHNALSRLFDITSRPLVGADSRLLIPTQADGSGVDRLVVTLSAGRDLGVITVGLLADVSQESAQRLAATTYGKVVEKIGLNDNRRQDIQLDAIIQANADLVILAGGTEKGASRSVGKLVELIILATKTLPVDKRPRVLYCGNNALAKRIHEVLARNTETQVTPNIRPTIDVEDIAPATDALAKMVTDMRSQQMNGLSALNQVSSAPLTLNANAMGRLVRFLSGLYDPTKGVLGVDLGASSTVFAAATAGKLCLNVFRPLGMGAGLSAVLQEAELKEIMRWLPVDIPLADVRDYLWQKTLYPASLPLSTTTLAIEQAAARGILRKAVAGMLENYPNLSMAFEPIFAGGAVLSQSSSPAQTLLMLLDGLQPTGVSTMFLDPYGLMAALGAIAPVNSVLPVQILESGAFLNLAAVICPISRARTGTTILRVKLVFEDGNENRMEIKQGSLTPLPVRHGQSVQVYLEALHGTEIDPRRRTSGGFKIIGGACGAVIDARGRPLILPEDAAKRRELLVRWSLAMENRRPA